MDIQNVDDIMNMFTKEQWYSTIQLAENGIQVWVTYVDVENEEYTIRYIAKSLEEAYKYILNHYNAIWDNKIDKNNSSI